MTSIVILTWDHPELLETSLNGILNYTDEPYELIVVDNGSNTPTKDLIESYKSRKPDLVVVTHAENQGFSKGMNSGIEKAKGDYIVVISNDVMVTDRRWIVNLTEPHLTNKCLTGGQYIYYNGLTSIGGRIVDYLGGWLLCFTKEFVKEVGMFDIDYTPAYFEDVDLSFRAKYIHGYELIQVDTGCYHNHPSATVADGRINVDSLTMRNATTYRAKMVNYINQYRINLPVGFREGKAFYV